MPPQRRTSNRKRKPPDLFILQSATQPAKSLPNKSSGVKQSQPRKATGAQEPRDPILSRVQLHQRGKHRNAAPRLSRPQTQQRSKIPQTKKVEQHSSRAPRPKTPTAETTNLQQSLVNDWTEQIVDAEPIKNSIVSEAPELPVTLDAWYRSYAYFSPQAEDMARGSTIPPSLANSRKKDGPSTAPLGTSYYRTALENRNVTIEPSETEDSLQETIQTQVIDRDHIVGPQHDAYLPDPSPQEQEYWRKDMVKCIEENESVFQRTIMMELFQRHLLKDKLDYTSESVWGCPQPPTESATISNWITGMPKPDVMIAFQRREVTTSDQSKCRAMKSLKGCISPEASKKNQRAFPFFFIEAKRDSGKETETAVLHQCLNVASQALHNIWTLMQKAKRHKDVMEEVRVFTVAAHSKGVLFRMHRVKQLPNESALVEPAYPWAFEYVVLKELEGKYDKMTVCRMVRNILFHYGVEILLPKLKKAVEDIVAQADTAAMREEPPPATQGSPANGTQSSSNDSDGILNDHSRSNDHATGTDALRQANSQGSRPRKQASTAPNPQKKSRGKKRSAEDPMLSFGSKVSNTRQRMENMGT